jgi:DNA-binding MarR family transcriptional regulator
MSISPLSGPAEIMVKSAVSPEPPEDATVKDKPTARTDLVSISEQGRKKAEEMKGDKPSGKNDAHAGKERNGEGAGAAGRAKGMNVQAGESKDEIVEDLQDTESDIRAVKGEIAEARRSPALSEDQRKQELNKLENKLDRLEDEAEEMKSDLAADE